MIYDKSVVFSRIIETIKQEILPDLTSSVAKEQGIAMISVLKNLDANMIVNTEHYQQENIEVKKNLIELASDILQEPQFKTSSLVNWAKNALKKLETTKTESTDPIQLWKELNHEECKLIQLLYQDDSDGLNSAREEYLGRARKLIRRQLEIEMAIVH